MTSNVSHVQEPSTAETFVDHDELHDTFASEPLPFVPNGLPRPTAPHRLSDRIPYTMRPQSKYSTLKHSPVKERTLDPNSFPPVIPPDHPSRTLVLCFDGTGDQFDADNSNIVNLFSLLKKDDRTQQMVYYQTGIGTYISPKVASRFMSNVSKTLDTMVAWHLDAHVMDGYEFLMQNYNAGDRICIFGFSRGAYTARSLAGMLHKVGLLPPDNWQQVPFAYKMYTETDAFGWDQSTDFKRAFCIEIRIEFLGVWDTVDSVGIIPRRLPFTTSNTIVRTFRHALSLDERRAKFKANLWTRPTEAEQKLGTPKASPSTSRKNTKQFSSTLSLRDRKKRDKAALTKWDPEDERFLSEMEQLHSEFQERPTDVEEVWFSGCHCDVGGGSVKNSERYSLARISLRWMVRECFKTGTGIMFDSERLQDIGLDPTSLYPFVLPRPEAMSPSGMQVLTIPKEPSLAAKALKTIRRKGSQIFLGKLVPHVEDPDPFINEEEEELADAMSPKYDQLKIVKLWWLLEWIPMVFRHQKENNSWVSWFGPNLARARYIPKRGTSVKVHRSVKIRMEAPGHDHKPNKQYVPKAALNFKEDVIWVD